MARSTFDEDEFEAETDRMGPYVKAEESSTHSAVPFGEFLHAPWGLPRSVTEMTTWLRALAGGAVEGVRVLDPDSVAAMTTPVGTFHTVFDGSTIEYGAGLTVQSVLGDRLVVTAAPSASRMRSSDTSRTQTWSSSFSTKTSPPLRGA